MLKNFKLIIVLLLFVVIGKSCIQKKEENTSDKEKLVKPLNPNGDSELALLMRELFEEAEQIKLQVANGEPITLNLDYEKILTAHATEPEKALSKEFKAFAKAYIATMDKLEEAKGGEAMTHYKSMVSICMSCHQTFCPGPLMRIEKLKM